MSVFTVISLHIPTYCHLIQIFILVSVSATPDKSIKETPQCQVNVQSLTCQEYPPQSVVLSPSL